MNRFENGFNSYKTAILELENRSNNEFKLKEIIINFHHAIEVLFKHILYSKNKGLIYKDINIFVKETFNQKLRENPGKKSGESQTAGFDETIKRIEVFFDEQIDQSTYNGFINLNKLRNALVHDEIELKVEEIEQIVVTLTPMVTAILQKYLEDSEKSVLLNL